MIGPSGFMAAPKQSTNKEMAYVAEDPAQPGAAWAYSIDDPRCVKETAKDIARWVKTDEGENYGHRNTLAGTKNCHTRWFMAVYIEKALDSLDAVTA